MSNCKIGNQASDNEVYLRDISAQEVCHLLMGVPAIKIIKEDYSSKLK